MHIYLSTAVPFIINLFEICNYNAPPVSLARHANLKCSPVILIDARNNEKSCKYLLMRQHLK